MAQEDPHSSSGFWVQVLCSLAGLQEWGCRSGTAKLPRLFQGLTVPLQHPLLGPGARPATATSG